MSFHPVVDENDTLISHCSKEELEREGHITRNVVVFVSTSTGELVVSKISDHKKRDAELFDVSVCGHVEKDEKYEDAAMRELKEELGVESDVKFLKKILHNFTHYDKPRSFFTGVFLAQHDGPFVMSHESSELRLMNIDLLFKEMEEHPEHFTQGFLKEIQEIQEHLQ